MTPPYHSLDAIFSDGSRSEEGSVSIHEPEPEPTPAANRVRVSRRKSRRDRARVEEISFCKMSEKDLLKVVNSKSSTREMREAAVRKITNVATLVKLLKRKWKPYMELIVARLSDVERMKLLFEYEAPERTCLECLIYIDQDFFLINIAMYYTNTSVGEAAVNKIVGDSSIQDVVLHAPQGSLVQRVASKRLLAREEEYQQQRRSLSQALRLYDSHAGVLGVRKLTKKEDLQLVIDVVSSTSMVGVEARKLLNN